MKELRFRFCRGASRARYPWVRCFIPIRLLVPKRKSGNSGNHQHEADRWSFMRLFSSLNAAISPREVDHTATSCLTRSHDGKNIGDKIICYN